VDAIQCLKKYGQRLDTEIADETGIALAVVREQFAALANVGEIIACKLTRFEDGKQVVGYVYRAAGYFPPPAPGRRAKAPS
jgi:hypothetical protein